MRIFFILIFLVCYAAAGFAWEVELLDRDPRIKPRVNLVFCALNYSDKDEPVKNIEEFRQRLSRTKPFDEFANKIGFYYIKLVQIQFEGHVTYLFQVGAQAFWRDPDGPEVDWIIDKDGAYTPLEVKWSDNPEPSDIRHLEVFLSEYKTAKQGFIVCQVPRKVKLSQRVLALPWQLINEAFV